MILKEVAGLLLYVWRILSVLRRARQVSGFMIVNINKHTRIRQAWDLKTNTLEGEGVNVVVSQLWKVQSIFIWKFILPAFINERLKVVTPNKS